MLQLGQTEPPHHDPVWTAIGSLLAVITTAIVAVWRDFRIRQKAKKGEYRDMAWDQASQIRQEYIKLLEQGQQREERLRAELLERERDAFVKDDIIADLKVREAARAARHNALVRRLQAQGDQGDDFQLWPETNGSSKE